MAAEIQVSPEIETLSSTLHEQTQSIVVRDAGTFQAAMELRRQVKDADRKAEAWFKELKRPIDAAKKAVLDKEKEVRNRLTLIVAEIDSKARPWEEAQEAERKRQEEEARAAFRKQVEDERIKQAIALEAQGKAEEAMAVVDAPISIPVIVPSIVPKVEGTSSRTLWGAEVVDPIAFLTWIVSDFRTRAHFVEFNQAAINKIGQQYHDSLAVPGLKVTSKQVYASRGM